jgi:hypothetical protein
MTAKRKTGGAKNTARVQRDKPVMSAVRLGLLRQTFRNAVAGQR